MNYSDDLRPSSFSTPIQNASSFPSHVYRYRPLPSEHLLDEISQALRNNAFWFSPVDDFNDPFESANILNAPNLKEIRDYIAAFQKKFGKEINIFGWPIEKIASDRGVTVKQAKKMISPTVDGANYYIQLVGDWHKWIHNGMLAASLSRRWDSVLMWSHYSNSHNGVCLEFEIDNEEMHRRSRSLEPIQYSHSRPRVSVTELMRYASMPFAEENQDFFDYPSLIKTGEKLSQTKAEQWRYEEEERVSIRSENGRGYYEVKSMKLSAILLGLRVKSEDRKAIRKNFGNECRIEDLVLHREQYELARVPIQS